MPIFIVETDVLDHRLECVVCPTKGVKLFDYVGIDKLIYEKAGKNELAWAFEEVMDTEWIMNPVISSGFALSEYIIHAVGADFIYSKNFQTIMYNEYDIISRFAIDKKFKSLVCAPIPYSYKRIGEMNSYSTCMTLMRYFFNIYALETNLYILVDRRAVDDYVNNYVSTYVSTSYPLSKRHKPRTYPFKNEKDLYEFLKETKVDKYPKLIKHRNFGFKCNNPKVKEIYNLIKEKYKMDDVSFCVNANLSKQNYQRMLEEDYMLNKDEMLGVAIALKLDVNKTNDLLKIIGESLDNTNERDNFLIECIENNLYDIIRINERLFLKNFNQLGSFILPYETINV